MKVQVFTDASLFDTLEPEWNALLDNSRANHIFLTWEWQRTWWSCFQPGDLYVITFRENGGDLIGIASCFIHDLPRFGRTLRLVGCVEVTDYLEVIAAKDREPEVLEALADHLLNGASGLWDHIDFCNIRDGSPTLAYLPDILRARGLDVQVKFEDVCPVIPLPETWEAYLDMLDGKQRREVRRKMRRAEGQGVTWRIVGPEDDLDAAMTTFLDLMAASAPDKARFLDIPGNRDFFRSLAHVLMDSGWLQLIFLDVGGTAVAAYLNFDYNNRIQVYNSGLDPSKYLNLSPGWVLLGHAIKHAIEQGRDEFDFLQGDEEYKHRMGGQDTSVWMLMADKPGA
ncbi:MAG: GNAT family N-acetyltransferase [Anaerolineae bacterium]|nr:GNAT family N-acetyltransferase [Anaerolineae bacterium]